MFIVVISFVLLNVNAIVVLYFTLICLILIVIVPCGLHWNASGEKYINIQYITCFMLLLRSYKSRCICI